MADRVYDSRAIANYLILNSPAGLDALQVMKLTYIAHGFTLGLIGHPLIEDDVEAWKLGPVVRRVYAQLPRGSSVLTKVFHTYPIIADLEDKERIIVDDILEKYGILSGLRLSSLTHQPGSPWDRTWNTYGQNAVIPQTLIRSHYQKIMKDYSAAVTAGKPYAIQAL